MKASASLARFREGQLVLELRLAVPFAVGRDLDADVRGLADGGADVLLELGGGGVGADLLGVRACQTSDKNSEGARVLRAVELGQAVPVVGEEEELGRAGAFLVDLDAVELGGGEAQAVDAGLRDGGERRPVGVFHVRVIRRR